MVNQNNIKKTNEKVKVGNRNAVLYIGQRGGKYIKVKGEYVKYNKKLQKGKGEGDLDGAPSVNSYKKPDSEIGILSGLLNNLNINTPSLNNNSSTSSSVQIVGTKTLDEIEAEKREKAEKEGNLIDLTGGKKKIKKL